MRVLLLAAALSLSAFSVHADEVIATHSGDSPAGQAAAESASGAATAADAKRQADGDWARRVMAGLPGDPEPERGGPDAQRSRCPPNDGKPHGEVSAGIGSGGYKTAGVYASQPLGECGEVAVAVSRTEGGNVIRSGSGGFGPGGFGRGGPHR